MKTIFKSLCLMVAMLALARSTTAQTFTTLYSFTVLGENDPTNRDGAGPYGLMLWDNTLFGTSSGGGSGGCGTVFAVSAQGKNFATLYNFVNDFGASGASGLILPGNTLYGTTYFGGNEDNGTVFATYTNTNGAALPNVHTFTATVFNPSNHEYTNSDGASPAGGVILSGNTLYGTAEAGGLDAGGTVFAVNTNGMGFTNLYNFTGGADGDGPATGLILSGSTLYGTTSAGGSEFVGTVFSISTQGTNFVTLHGFDASVGATVGTYEIYTNSDGFGASGSLILSGNTLYGTASKGGAAGNGTVFSVTTNGSNFTTLHSFTATPGENGISYEGPNTDGSTPQGGVVLLGGKLYGTALYGGSAGNGTVFSISTNGSNFTTVHSFTAEVYSSGSFDGYTNSDGASPADGLISSGHTLYGTASSGGTGGTGTVFAIDLAIPLNIKAAHGNVVLSWSDPTFSLQAAPTAAGDFTNVAGAASPYTNAVKGKAEFFRLQSD